MDDMAVVLNQGAPDVGAFHGDVELRPGLHADIAVPKGASQLDWERLHRALAVSWKLPPCRSMITTAGKSRTVNF